MGQVAPANHPEAVRRGVSILIPAYNEEELLEEAVREVHGAASEVLDAFELIIVNDGSADRTGEIMERLAAGEDGIRGFHHERNRGMGGGIVTAASHASYEYAVVSPVDSPLSARQLAVFMAAAAPDAVVIGCRPRRLGYSGLQQLGSRVYHDLACFLLRLPLRDINWIHLYPTRLFDDLDIEFSGIVYLGEVLAKARDLGYRLVEVDSPMTARIKGVATISKPGAIWRTFWDLWRLWWRLTTRRRTPRPPRSGA